MTPDFTTVLLLVILQILLSPGLFLTLPPNSRDICKAQGVATCDLPSPQSVDCDECMAAWTSGFTSRWAVFVHTVLFFAIAQLFMVQLPSVDYL